MVTVRPKNHVNEVTCPCCKSELIYEENDIIPIYCGKGIVCPVCGEDIVIKKVKPFEFPDGFYHFGERKEVAHLTDNEVQEYIDDTVKNLRKSNLEFDLSYQQCGDTIVFGFKNEEGITVWVAKNYYEADEFFD